MSMNRRTFLATALAGGLAPRPRGTFAAQAPGADVKGLTRADLPTPALLLNLDAFEANLRTMAEHCQRSGVGFRPHAKTHKCPEIARRQVASGALGVCVATVPEAEAMVAAGIPGVLLTSPIVDRGKVGRMVALAKRGGDVMLAVGHPREGELLAEAAEAAGVVLKVLVDVDVGDRRTGVLPGGPALELARLLAKSKHLRLVGVQAYSGSASHTVGFERRQKVSREAMLKAVEVRDLLARHGLETQILSGGSTGTYNIDSAIRGVTELQVGSYVFMDVDYRRIGGKDGPVYTDFRPSLTVLTTVVSATHPDRVSVDAGTKAFATDVTSRPEAKGWEGLSYSRAGDEFGSLTAADGTKLPRLGDRLEFLVPHCDPTVNLYDHLWAMRGEKVEAVWPIVARRELVAPRPHG
ncbi:MAG TPA: DSD1 family PLP-dependent enzyme [Gemmataceae bacterium]|nr:DSD1 family PLP-dependent enzyme [Gemmataceae bacterium]